MNLKDVLDSSIELTASEPNGIHPTRLSQFLKDNKTKITTIILGIQEGKFCEKTFILPNNQGELRFEYEDKLLNISHRTGKSQDIKHKFKDLLCHVYDELLEEEQSDSDLLDELKRENLYTKELDLLIEYL
tara:strand:- start:1660 stop:2052 length:393 start_codon:yes stop_codon:yes gene_type:complete